MAIDLLKKKVGIVLAKRKLEKVVCEVKAAFDISGSMEWMYNNGAVQHLTDRLLAVASERMAHFDPTSLISEEEMNRRLGVTEDDLAGFDEVEIE